MAENYDMAVFIGRFQPFHNGHLHVILEAFRHVRELLIIIGSVDGPRTLRNPFTYGERENMIVEALADHRFGVNGRYTITSVEDCAYNDTLWAERVQQAVNDFRQKLISEGKPAEKIALIGHAKDHTSYYLKMFPQWGSIPVSNFEKISGTAIREAWLAGPDRSDRFVNQYCLPRKVLWFMREAIQYPEFISLANEYKMIREYRQAWAAAPYPPTFVTVDACVVQSSHILLVQRKDDPGAGLWALPGGFLGQNERIVDGMIRELREETRLKVPVPVLRGSIATMRVFDDPHRDERGRVITHAALVRLPESTQLPEVRGSSDAKDAKWWPLAEVKRSMMYADHYDIIKALIGTN